MDDRENAYARHQQRRLLRPDAHLWLRPDAASFLKPGTDPADVYPALAQRREQLRQKQDRAIADAIAYERAVLADLRAELNEIKADRAERRRLREQQKYSQSQPRVPAGNGRDSGRWSDASYGNGDRPRVVITTTNVETEDAGDGSGSDTGFSLAQPMGGIDFGDLGSAVDSLFEITPRDNTVYGVQLAGDPPQRLPPIIVTPGEAGETGQPGIGHNQGPPLEDTPDIPRTRPRRSKVRTARQRAFATWIGRAITFGRYALLKRFLTIVSAIPWIQPYWAQIKTYLDPPKTLEELKAAVASTRPGTEVHHIVEEEALRKMGFSKREIDSPGNRIRIPTLKHYEITAWYGTPNPDYGGLTPREYLADKSLLVRTRIGLMAAKRAGVLKK